MSNVTEKFYNNVAVEATKKRMTLIQVSMAMGKSPSTLSARKSKGASPTLDTIVEISKAIGCPIKNLIEGI